MKNRLRIIGILAVVCVSTTPAHASTFKYEIYDDFEDTDVDLTKWDTDSVINIPNIGGHEYSGYLNIDLVPDSGVESVILESTRIFQGEFDVRARWYDGLFEDADNKDNYGTEHSLYVFGVDSSDEVRISRGFYPLFPSDTILENEWLVVRDDKVLSTTFYDSPADFWQDQFFGIQRKGNIITTYFSDMDYIDYAMWQKLADININYDGPLKFGLSAKKFNESDGYYLLWEDVKVGTSAVPEPASIALLCSGITGLWFTRGKRKDAGK